MKAVQIDACGGPENLVLREIATPEPGSSEALVRLEYAGVDYTDRILEAGETRGRLLLKTG